MGDIATSDSHDLKDVKQGGIITRDVPFTDVAYFLPPPDNISNQHFNKGKPSNDSSYLQPKMVVLSGLKDMAPKSIIDTIIAEAPSSGDMSTDDSEKKKKYTKALKYFLQQHMDMPFAVLLVVEFHIWGKDAVGHSATPGKSLKKTEDLADAFNDFGL